MKKFFLCILSFILLHSLTLAQTALIEIPFTFSDGVAVPRVLIAGLDPTATDGEDSHLGEIPLPPPPFGFYARFLLPGGTIETWKDIRQGDNTASSIGEIIHTINYGLEISSTGLTITWDLPFGVGLNLKDPFGGIIFNEDFPKAQPGSYTITNLALTSLLLTVKYIDPPFPVELTSFSAKAQSDKIILTWETATEVNNYGFDIERKVLNGAWSTLGFVEGNGNSNSPKSYSFVDENISFSGTYYYRLKQIDTDGSYEYSPVIEVKITPPLDFELNQNYPNPFNPSTVIKYNLPETRNVTLFIYNASGEMVRTLVSGSQDAGYYLIMWDAKNDLGSKVSSGMYIYALHAGDYYSVKKMMLLK